MYQHIHIYIIWYDSIHLQSPLPKHTQDFLSITYLDCLSRIHPIHLSSSHVSSSLTVCLCVCVSVCHVFVQSQRARQWKLASSEVKVPWGYYIVYPVLGVLVLCCCAGACCLGRNAAQKGGNTSSTSAARRNEEKEGSPWDTQGKDRLIDGLNSHFFCSSFNLRSNVFPNFFVERTNHSWRLLRNTHGESVVQISSGGVTRGSSMNTQEMLLLIYLAFGSIAWTSRGSWTLNQSDLFVGGHFLVWKEWHHSKPIPYNLVT